MLRHFSGLCNRSILPRPGAYPSFAPALPPARYMAELSKHVPIIPVIMKADTMTIHEAQRFRQEVVNRLQNPGAAGVCVCARGAGGGGRAGRQKSTTRQAHGVRSHQHLLRTALSALLLLVQHDMQALLSSPCAVAALKTTGALGVCAVDAV